MLHTFNGHRYWKIYNLGSEITSTPEILKGIPQELTVSTKQALKNAALTEIKSLISRKPSSCTLKGVMDNQHTPRKVFDRFPLETQKKIFYTQGMAQIQK
jgi:hypothetical protein